MTPLLVAALATQLHLASIFSRGAAPAPSCGITTVSYRFVGTPGTPFRYEGSDYLIPATGSIELLAGKHTTAYEHAGRQLPLEVWPRDAFGTRTVPVGQQQPVAPEVAAASATAVRQ
ncbi:MAG TPA: hypothetical protein VGJ81_02815 [Thermoanaerobaculia bacterium]|jgi:hypothetical protein